MTARRPRNPDGRYTHSRYPIPDEDQRPMRERLGMIRLSKGLHLSDVGIVSTGTLSYYERHDLSSLQLGMLYGLAKEYNYAFEELIEVVFAGSDIPNINHNHTRLLRLFNLLNDDDQSLVLVLLETIADQRGISWRNKRRPYIQKPRRTSPQLLGEAEASS